MRRESRVKIRAYCAAFLVLAIVLTATLARQSAQLTHGDSSLATIQLCRAWIEPCQNEIHVEPGDSFTLDIRLNVNEGDPLSLVGWETHFQVVDTLVLTVATSETDANPVREQGSDSLALDGLSRLTADEANPAAQYFTVQNQYNQDTGLLDYAVTLLNFGPSEPPPRVAPFTIQDSLILGRITLQSDTVGVAKITGIGTSADPFLALNVTPDSDSVDAQALGFADPLATVTVESVPTTPTLAGQASPQIPFDTADAARLGIVITITLWTQGSIPSWQGGGAEPVATFYNISTDAEGNFQVSDVPPALVAPGIYDLRIRADGALSSLIPGVVVPSGNAASVTNLTPVILFQGDIDGNNAVNALDLAALKSSFGKLDTEEGYNSLADFNRDNVIDGQDFSRLAQNYGATGS